MRFWVHVHNLCKKNKHIWRPQKSYCLGLKAVKWHYSLMFILRVDVFRMPITLRIRGSEGSFWTFWISDSQSDADMNGLKKGISELFYHGKLDIFWITFNMGKWENRVRIYTPQTDKEMLITLSIFVGFWWSFFKWFPCFQI